MPKPCTRCAAEAELDLAVAAFAVRYAPDTEAAAALAVVRDDTAGPHTCIPLSMPEPYTRCIAAADAAWDAWAYAARRAAANAAWDAWANAARRAAAGPHTCEVDVPRCPRCNWPFGDGPADCHPSNILPGGTDCARRPLPPLPGCWVCANMGYLHRASDSGAWEPCADAECPYSHPYRHPCPACALTKAEARVKELEAEVASLRAALEKWKAHSNCLCSSCEFVRYDLAALRGGA